MCGLVKNYQIFGEILLPRFTLKMENVCPARNIEHFLMDYTASHFVRGYSEHLLS